MVVFSLLGYINEKKKKKKEEEKNGYNVHAWYVLCYPINKKKLKPHSSSSFHWKASGGVLCSLGEKIN